MSGRRTPTGPSSVPEVNLAILGALGVGKSALTVKYITKRFINEYDPELEDTYSKLEFVDQKEVLLNIMDTYDKEGKSPERYLKWADAFIVVYSITSKESFEEANTYLDLIQNSAERVSPLMLVGNKVDLERYRQVSKEEGSEIASRYEATFLESTAAEEFEEVAAIFQEITKQVLRRRVFNKSYYIGDETAYTNGTRVSSPRPHKPSKPFLINVRRTEDRNVPLAERNPKLKLFNKGFKIFQS